jgi:hypothetical protein
MNCEAYVACPAVPVLLGFNSGTPDVLNYTGLGYGPNTPPPLNWMFDRTTAFAIAYNPFSAQLANQAALTAAISKAQAGWVAPGGTPPVEWESPPVEDLFQFDWTPGGIDEPPPLV